MIRIRNLGTGRLVSPELGDKIALLCPPFFEFDEQQTVLRQNCHLYANFGGEIKRKREGRSPVRGLKRKRREGGRAATRGARGEFYPICGVTHVVARRGGTSDGGSFSEAAYTARQSRQATENVFYFSKRDVWRQFHCAFHSVGRFEIQARIPFVPEQRGDKAGDGRTRRGLRREILYRCREDYER